MTQAQNVKDEAHAKIAESVIAEWNKTKPIYVTDIFLRNRSTGELSHSGYEQCYGHETINEAIECMEFCMPNIKKFLSEKIKQTIALAVPLAKRVGVPFDPVNDVAQPIVTITKTTVEIVEVGHVG